MYKLFFKIILLHSIVFSHQFFLTTTEVRLSDNQKSLEITILREPNKRFVSEYIYNRFKQSSWVKSESEISAYLTSEKAKLSCTTYARFFSHFNDPEEILANKDEAASSAIENLKRFSSVGILEDLESWKTKFNKSFDTRITISSKNTTPNSEEANKIYNPLCQDSCRLSFS